MAAPNAAPSGTTGCNRRKPASRTASPADCAWQPSDRNAKGQTSGAFRMRIFRTAMLAAGFTALAAPAWAQAPHVNLMPELQSKTPEEKEAEAAREKAYRESLKKIPDAKVSDQWGTM